MKKYFFALAALVLAAVSCGKEQMTPADEKTTPEVSGEKVEITLNVSSTATKTYVSDPATGAISWEAGDAVGVFTDLDTATPIQFTMTGAPGATADFTGSVSAGATKLYVFYPYDAGATFAAGKITMSLPSVQTVQANNVAKGAMVALGEGSGSGSSWSVTLVNAFSYIKFKLATEDVKKIVLSGGSDYLAGSATFNVADGVMTGTGNASSITATHESGYFTKDTYYYIPVLPGTVASLSFAMTSNTNGGAASTSGYDDWMAERTAGSSLTFARGTGLKFDALDADGATNSWSWYFDIHDAASLERFRALVAAGDFPAAGVAKFTSDVNLSGETLAAASGTFSGTLDGQGHSITNWESNGVSLFNLVTGTVKNFTVASSCTLSFPTPLTGSFGFICVDVQSAGKFDNITFDASVSQSGVSVTGGTYHGLYAGRCYGVIENCTNNGDISLTVSSFSASNNVYLGGMVGYFNSGDRRAAYRDTNNGNISYRVNAKGYFVFLGGITAGTSTSVIANATSSKGTIQECINTGNVSYYCTNGGSMEDNAGTGGTGNYFKVGGVAGYWEGNIIDCTNGVNGNATKGQVSATVPTNESTACATGPSIGGVAAFVLRNMTGCKNYGTVSIKGTFAGGGTGNAGNGVTAEFAAGGVVGQIGPQSDAGTYALSDCHNYGTLDFKGWMATGNGTGFNFGGVAGFSIVPVSDCSNNGLMTAESKGAYVRMGGVVGYASTTATVTDLTNNGNLDFRLVRSTAGAIDTYKQLSAQLRIGGVVGFTTTTASSCVNNNPMTLTTTAADNLSANLQVGGVVGYAGSTVSGTNNVNGDITITHSGKQVKCGGVLGEGVAQSLGSACKNYGDLDITCGSIAQSWFGGVFGSIPAPGSGNNTHTGLENHGNISLAITTSQNEGFYYLGGVSGTSAASQVFTNCKNYGDLTYSGDAKIRIGGINAYMNQTATGSVVECDITASCTGRDYSEVGGVSAYTAATNLLNWSFTGTINTSGSTKKVYTGGLLGKCNGASAFNGCTFEGTLTGADGNNVPGLYVGGLQANSLAIKFGNSSKCVVKTGAVVNGSPIASLTESNLISQSSDGGTYASSATLTNIVIE